MNEFAKDVMKYSAIQFAGALAGTAGLFGAIFGVGWIIDKMTKKR